MKPAVQPFRITCARIYLREMSADDAAQVYELNNDPEVTKYTGEKPFANRSEAEQFLKNYDQYRRNGYGRWAVIRNEDQQWLGWCGLKYLVEEDETDIGFRFHRRFWNQGYSSEAALACLHYGFRNLNLEFITAHVMKDNAASIRVLEKIGMKYWKDHVFHQHPGCYYIANREDDETM